MTLMARITLGQNAREEIRESIRRCRDPREIAAEVGRLSHRFGVSPSRVYALTEDLRPRRKTRADKGKRAADLNTHEGLRLVTGMMLEYGVNAADAVNLGRQRGIDIPVEFTTVNRYLRESGLDKKRRRRPEVPHRRFEASAPGELFQFDMSGLKERWFDFQTRKIVHVSPLEVSRNHENTKASRVKVWRFSLIDDFSRRCFIRFVAVQKPNSSHVVDFLLQGYAEMGVPHRLYTDNDTIIKFGRNQRASEILNKVLLDQGGYENIFHLPGNARATGKIERLHATSEQCEKFIGLYLKERGNLDIEVLNERLARGIQNRINNEIHSTTGQRPLERWESTLSVVRRLDYESLRSAFMVDEFVLKLHGDLTIRHKGKRYQLPTGDRYPFANWIGQKLRIVFPDGQSFFTVVGLDGNEYDVAKEAHAPDVAGEFRSTRETDAERLRKELRGVARENAKAVKAAGEVPFIPFFDEAEQVAAASGNVARFPKPETEIMPADIAEVAPGRVAVHDPAINFWEAVSRFEGEFASKAEAKEFMDSIFASRDEECWLLSSEVESAVAARRPATGTVRLLKAV